MTSGTEELIGEVAMVGDENTPLDKMPIVYPRWLSHLVKDRVYVQSEEDAAPYYAEGYEPWPIIVQPTDVEIVKGKVLDLEKQIEALLSGLSEADEKRIVHEIYGEAKAKKSEPEPEAAPEDDTPEGEEAETPSPEIKAEPVVSAPVAIVEKKRRGPKKKVAA